LEDLTTNSYIEILSMSNFGIFLITCAWNKSLFVLRRTSNFSAIWRLSPLPMTGLQI
jgi:hypothetical protein